MTETLARRLTHRYVGTYRHLDQWQDVGDIDELRTESRSTDEDGDDPCDPLETTIEAVVSMNDPAATDSDIRAALASHYTAHDCAHEYDCCGCRSYRFTDAERVTGNLWRIRVSSARNY